VKVLNTCIVGVSITCFPSSFLSLSLSLLCALHKGHGRPQKAQSANPSTRWDTRWDTTITPPSASTHGTACPMQPSWPPWPPWPSWPSWPSWPPWPSWPSWGGVNWWVGPYRLPCSSVHPCTVGRERGSVGGNTHVGCIVASKAM
jgi:hypothetical protein